MSWNNLEDILNFAINNEIEAADFYSDLANKVKNPNTQILFRDFAKEEMRHKKILENIKAGGNLRSATETVVDLKIGDYLVEVDQKDNLGYQDALILAMKREKAAFMLYTDLANASGSAELKEVFASLAQEEARHKLSFETEYDQHILGEN
ncbi:MAG: ferritin family protein [Gemmatimonadales bacterium]|nr:ferritin family protein [Gemmatimonadales bacterium]